MLLATGPIENEFSLRVVNSNHTIWFARNVTLENRFQRLHEIT